MSYEEHLSSVGPNQPNVQPEAVAARKLAAQTLGAKFGLETSLNDIVVNRGDDIKKVMPNLSRKEVKAAVLLKKVFHGNSSLEKIAGVYNRQD